MAPDGGRRRPPEQGGDVICMGDVSVGESQIVGVAGQADQAGLARARLEVQLPIRPSQADARVWKYHRILGRSTNRRSNSLSRPQRGRGPWMRSEALTPRMRTAVSTAPKANSNLVALRTSAGCDGVE